MYLLMKIREFTCKSCDSISVEETESDKMKCIDCVFELIFNFKRSNLQTFSLGLIIILVDTIVDDGRQGNSNGFRFSDLPTEYSKRM